MGGYSRVNFGISNLNFSKNLGGGISDVNFDADLKSEAWNWNGLGGGLSGLKFQKGALLENLDTKFTVQPETCLCITDSLSLNTKYVETNK